MGGSNFNPNFVDECPPAIADTMIFLEDDFIRAHKYETPDVSIQKLWSPFWRIRSEYQDTIFPIEVNTKLVCNLRPEINAGCEALRRGDKHNLSIGFIILEAAWCYKLYTVYLSKLRDLLARVKHIEQATELRKVEMIYEYNISVNFDPVLSQRFIEHVVYSLDMAAVLKTALLDSIMTGKRVLQCSNENLMEMSRIYYQLGITPPLDPFSRSVMLNCWRELRKEETTERRCVIGKNKKNEAFRYYYV